MPEVTGYKCDSCEALVPEDQVDEEEVLYECDSCGTFKRSETDNENHQCPHCHKFGSRAVEGWLCPVCEEGELDQEHPLKLWQCSKCGTCYTTRRKSCPECKRKLKLEKRQEWERTTPVEGPMTFDGVPEADLPYVERPCEILTMEWLPNLVKVGDLVYQRGSGYLKSASHVFGQGEPLSCSYSLATRARDKDGKSVDLWERPGPYREAREARQDTFALFWVPEPGLLLRPLGAVWGEGHWFSSAAPVHVERPPESVT